MKHVFALIILPLLLFTACNENKNGIANSIMNTGNLTIQSFSINTKQDNSITTKDGIKIKITGGSIEASTDIVTLEIKEAISLEAMLKAGLTTQSNEGLLSSDGMFYIATKETSVIKKPIEVAVPVEFADNRMQLYKGDEDDGKITWKEPEAITQLDTSITALGESLFKINCSSCHAVEKKLTGPALAWIDKRRSKEWLYAFTRSSAEVIKNGDSYACCVYNQYNKTAMNWFPLLSNADIDAIYRYVDKEAKRLNIPENFNTGGICDSCDQYNTRISMRDTGYAIKPDATIENTVINSEIPIENATEYYYVNIESYDWYNIDRLLKEDKSLEKCKLSVQVETPQNINNLNLFLIIPSLKVITQGFYENDDKYVFWGTEENISLPVNSDAFIIAIAEDQGNFHYQQKRFTIRKEQLIRMELAKATQENIYASFKLLRFDDLSILIEKETFSENEYYADSLGEPTILSMPKDSIIGNSDPCDCSSLNGK